MPAPAAARKERAKTAHKEAISAVSKDIVKEPRNSRDSIKDAREQRAAPHGRTTLSAHPSASVDPLSHVRREPLLFPTATATATANATTAVVLFFVLIMLIQSTISSISLREPTQNAQFLHGCSIPHVRRVLPMSRYRAPAPKSLTSSLLFNSIRPETRSMRYLKRSRLGC